MFVIDIGIGEKLGGDNNLCAFELHSVATHRAPGQFGHICMEKIHSSTI